MKDFLEYCKSKEGILAGASCFLIGYGFGFKLGLGVIGSILYLALFFRK